MLPGQPINIDNREVPAGYHIVPGQNYIVPSDGNNVNVPIAKNNPKNNTTFVHLTLQYEFGNQIVSYRNVLYPINISKNGNDIDPMEHDFMKAGYVPQVDAWHLNYNADPSSYTNQYHTFTYKAQPVDIQVVFKDANGFITNNDSDNGSLGNAKKSDLGRIGVNGQNIDIDADNADHIGVINGQGIYVKNGAPVTFSLPTGYHLQNANNIISVSSDMKGNGNANINGNPVMVLTLNAVGGKKPNSSNQPNKPNNPADKGNGGNHTPNQPNGPKVSDVNDTINFMRGKKFISTINKHGARGTSFSISSDIPSGYNVVDPSNETYTYDGSTHTVQLGVSRPNGYQPVTPSSEISTIHVFYEAGGKIVGQNRSTAP